MKTQLIFVLAGALLLATEVSVMAAEPAAGQLTAYNFTVTDKNEQVLGTGKIRLPFKFGSEGQGTAEWEFTPTQAGGKDKYWQKAKARLARGRGEAEAECKNSWFTLNFHPGVADNNVTVHWALQKEKSGAVSFDDFSGGHSCASFTIRRK